MSWDSDDLTDLRHHWAGAYVINGGNGSWCATRTDTGASLLAATPDDLRSKIRTDYESCPVPRPPISPEIRRIARKFT